MAWSTAKARIATVLATVAITSPVSQTIKRVYTDVPGTVQDLPCFILYPPALDVGRRVSLRTKTYTLRMRLLVTDTDLDQACALVDAYREAIIDAFDIDVTLNATVTLINGPRIEEAAGFTYGGRNYTGMDCMLTVIMQEAVAFAP